MLSNTENVLIREKFPEYIFQTFGKNSIFFVKCLYIKYDVIFFNCN